jgi:DNA repair exonuclease SbcCD nuclease subunit
MSERRPLRLVHTADVHLGAYAGSPDGQWSERRSLMEAAFSNVIDLALGTSADGLLICGDFFDNDRVESDVVEFAAAEIRRFDRPVIVLPGNHDPMDEGRLYSRHQLEADSPNLTLIRDHAGQIVEPPGLDLLLWGRAYYDSDWHFRPLAGIPARKDGQWHVAMAHGHFVRHDGEMHRSMLIHESEVAAAAGDWDYLALGHWEPHADVSSGGLPAVYSGAPLPLSDVNRKAGWAVVVDFDGKGVRWRPERVDPRDKGLER